MRSLSLLLLLGVTFFLTACGTVNRVESDVSNLNVVVDRNCIPNGILNVESLKAERLPMDTKPLYKCKAQEALESFRYAHKDQEVYVHACYEGDKLIDFRQNYQAKGLPRKSVTEGVEKVMERVEASIVQTCGLNIVKRN